MNELAKQFVATINDINQSKHRDEVFRDFCNMAYCALAKPCQPNATERDRLEAQYMEVVKRYRNKDDIRENMPKLLSLTVLGLSNGNCDFLGEVAGELGVLDAKLGQFFTPYHISKMMAQINLVGAKEHIEQKGYLTVQEPAVGAGGMLLAVADVVEDLGVKLETSLWIDAVELSVSTFHMAYVQLAARGIAGVVRRGNSLSHEMFESVFLPATPHFLTAHPTFLDEQQAIAKKPAQKQELQKPSKPVQTELIF